ncbi:MAG: LytTR family transcriptional regulator [Cyclobacteriaceae bacterium]|nr:LytTR family transcriptional regulator [Cyclobacteriaceae bacterium]
MLMPWLNREIPKNLLIKKPLAGFAAITVFGLLFVTIYSPFGTSAVDPKLFLFKMTAYAILVATSSSLATIFIVKSLPVDSKDEWTIRKELLSFMVILIVMGLTIYFAAFILEPAADRWNLDTMLDSFKYAVFIGFLPYLFFSLMHAPFWFSNLPVEEEFYKKLPGPKPEAEPLLSIVSKLKKESLEFHLSELLCIASEGNYVIFYIYNDGKLQKKMIRNSMNEIEQQLQLHECLIRVHRAYIVNIHKVVRKKGNALGYRLQLDGLAEEIPVSRNKVQVFDEKLSKFQ